VSKAVSQLASSALVVLKYMPPNITPPMVIRYGATDVPIIQLSLSSDSLPDSKLNDLGQNIIRPALAVVHGAEVPYPYGGKPRVIMADLDERALQSRSLSSADISAALQRQNVILPAGDVKVGNKDYPIAMNNSPDVIDSINDFPIKEVHGRMVFMRDVARVHDGFQIQTNSVSVDGSAGALMTLRKTGGVSTLAVIDGVRKALPDIQHVLPAGVKVRAIFDQSIFVKAALNSVVMGGMMAAGLTAAMMLLFLGNWRLTIIILAAIPLSIVIAILIMYLGGNTLNTMTLGGFALAVGILVDNGTVVIENIERHVGLLFHDPHPDMPVHVGANPIDRLELAILRGTGEVGIPTALSTLCICIVFVPVFLLQGTAKYLFSPLSVSVCVSLLASLGLSFTLVPLLFRFLMRAGLAEPHGVAAPGASVAAGRPSILQAFGQRLMGVHVGFNAGFERFREGYRNALAWSVDQSGQTLVFFIGLMLVSLAIFPFLGRDFFPQVDAGQMRLHVRAPAGTRLETTQDIFANVERKIREMAGPGQVAVILDNIGLPYSGINMALSDSTTVGPMDGEILIALSEHHRPTAELMAQIRKELPRVFPDLQFFFQPADIVDQVLNFGQPAPIDVRIAGYNSEETYALANRVVAQIRTIPGIVDAHVFQVPDAPALAIDLDRRMAAGMGISQQGAATGVFVATNSSAQAAPNFWVDPKNSVSYPLVVQVPSYRIASAQDLMTSPVLADPGHRSPELLMNVSQLGRRTMPLVTSQFNIRPVFDVHADIQGIDLDAAATKIQAVLDADRPPPDKAISIKLSGQVETMQQSYTGLFGGIGLAVVLVYLFLVINFQSWIDPLIVLLAVPFALGGVIWMLFLTHTHLSVPALMGSLMCIGLTTANSILVVSFANQRMTHGDSAKVAAIVAGVTRLRPVLMTAGAMIIGMVPMALGVGEGGEQNAPLARAVMGGLMFATFATLVFVPAMYRTLRRGAEAAPAPPPAPAAVAS
jgi:multidrug efflux pump subunit AcrB